ncbi:MAG: iron-containing alcohol dehydrogenase [Anaerolineae bacterium]|nr:iron-containing alcohol dehydrogenase [Anaerolineae bacterium]
MRFEFATANRIIFGPGTLNECGPLAARMGRHALVVTGRSPERAAPLLELLSAQQITSVTFPVPEEPTTDQVQEGVRIARESRCDLVIGIGGGSALDVAKAIAVLVTNKGDLFDYLEVIGRGQPLTEPGLPLIAIPTTSGTGSEVTRNAVLGSTQHRVKVSLRSYLMLPSLALVDPELTRSMPPQVTAISGLDAFTQLVEPYVSNRANVMTDALCREGIVRVARSLYRAYVCGDDMGAREDMALASLFGGLALSNAGLGAVHGFAGPLGGMFKAPHGALCGRLLPCVMAMNVRALRTRLPGSEPLRRYEEIARLLTGDPEAAAEDGVAWVERLVEQLGGPRLSAYGVTPADFPAVIEKAVRASSMQANPVALTGEDMEEVLRRAL